MGTISKIANLIGYVIEAVTYLPRRASNSKSNIDDFVALQKHLGSMGLSKGVEHSAADSFDIYCQKRIANIEGFSKTLCQDGTSISQKLKEDTDDSRVVKSLLANTLVQKPYTMKARGDFNDYIAFVNKEIKNEKFFYNPEGLVSALHKEKDIAHKAITKQHIAEKSELIDLFKNEDFTKALTKSLKLADKDQVDQIQKDMVSTLKKSQEKELETFKQSMNDSITKMHNEAQSKFGLYKYTVDHYEKNPNMRRVIDQLLARKNKTEGNITVEIGSNDKNDMVATFKGIEMKDILEEISKSESLTLETVTGRKVLYSEETKTFTIQLPNRFSSFAYYRGRFDLMSADMTSIALAVKALGYDSITMSISHPNKEHALELARQACIGARSAGFESNKITVKVTIDGKVQDMSESDLFANSPSGKDAGNAAAAKYKTMQESLERRENNPFATADIKKRVKEHRNLAEEAKAPEAKAAEQKRPAP